MTETQLKLAIEHDGGIAKVRFVDRHILEETTISQIGQELTSIIDGMTNPKILVNFENVEHLSSAALVTLITINNKTLQKGGQLRLSNIESHIYEVFVITKLNKIFKIYGHAREACESFS